MEEKLVRRAIPDDALWIVELSERVQTALTATGSLQQIGPLPIGQVQQAINARAAYILEKAGQPLGSVLIDALPATSPLREAWKVQTLPAPLWFLHALMLEPAAQGQKLGLDFLHGVRHLVIPTVGTIFLDCWAGNAKLRAFYLRAGFTFHGVFPYEDYEVAVFCSSAIPAFSN